jgi:hypothetical protein
LSSLCVAPAAAPPLVSEDAVGLEPAVPDDVAPELLADGEVPLLVPPLPDDCVLPEDALPPVAAPEEDGDVLEVLAEGVPLEPVPLPLVPLADGAVLDVLPDGVPLAPEDCVVLPEALVLLLSVAEDWLVVAPWVIVDEGFVEVDC